MLFFKFQPFICRFSSKVFLLHWSVLNFLLKSQSDCIILSEFWWFSSGCTPYFERNVKNTMTGFSPFSPKTLLYHQSLFHYSTLYKSCRWYVSLFGSVSVSAATLMGPLSSPSVVDGCGAWAAWKVIGENRSPRKATCRKAVWFPRNPTWTYESSLRCVIPVALVQ